MIYTTPTVSRRSFSGRCCSILARLCCCRCNSFRSTLHEEPLLKQVHTAWSRMILDASVAGSRLTNLFPVHSRSWWPMVKDVFSSKVSQTLSRQLILECKDHDKFTYLSIDGTVKSTMPLLGQVRPGGKHKRAEGPLFINPADAIRTVVTVRGRSGEVVGFWPLLSEKAEYLQEAFIRNLPRQRFSKFSASQLTHPPRASSQFCSRSCLACKPCAWTPFTWP